MYKSRHIFATKLNFCKGFSLEEKLAAKPTDEGIRVSE